MNLKKPDSLYGTVLETDKNTYQDTYVIADTEGRAAEELALFLTLEQIAAPTGDLTPVQRRFAEIVRACVMPADFLVMDEPFYGMSPEERKKALDYILEVRGNRPLLIAAQDLTDLDFARVIRL